MGWPRLATPASIELIIEKGIGDMRQRILRAMKVEIDWPKLLGFGLCLYPVAWMFVSLVRFWNGKSPIMVTPSYPAIILGLLLKPASKLQLVLVMIAVNWLLFLLLICITGRRDVLTVSVIYLLLLSANILEYHVDL